MTNGNPNVVELAQHMVLAVNAFADALDQLDVNVDDRDIELLRIFSQDLAESVRVVIAGDRQAGTSLVVRVPIDELHRWRERLPEIVAWNFQCSREDAVLFLAWRDDPDLIPTVPCNHPGCRNKIRTNLSNIRPSDVRAVITRATTELWYCHVHARHALHHDHAVSDHIAAVLARMQASPGSSGKDLDIDTTTRNILLSNGLATRALKGIGHSQWTITDLGTRILQKRAGPPSPPEPSPEAS